MHLSLWTLESREFVNEWCTSNFEKIPITVVSSWQNMYLLAADRGQRIMWIKGKQLSIFGAECYSRLYFILIVPCSNGMESLGETVLKIAVYIVAMMSDLNQCLVVGDYRIAVSDCDWAMTSLLDTATRPCAFLPWALLCGLPENVLAHMSPVMKVCLHESLPSSMACLVSRDRQIASTSSWDLLPSVEQLCLALFLRSHASTSDCIIRLVSQPNSPLYRLIQVELVPDVALLIICGAHTSLDLVRTKATQYWGPLMTELHAFQPRVIRYGPLDSVPDRLLAFFQLRAGEGHCTSGSMHLQDRASSCSSSSSSTAPTDTSTTIEETMKRLFLQSRSSALPITVGCTVLRDKAHDLTFVVCAGDDCPGGTTASVLAFTGLVEGTEARSMAGEVVATIDRWAKCNRGD